MNLFKKYSLIIFILSIVSGQSNIISISDTVMVGGDTAWVSINVSNTDDIAGIQFDLSYPDQFAYIDSVIAGDRFVDHELQVEFLDPMLRVMVYSASLTPITGNSGTVLTLGFATEPVLGEFEIEFINPVLANTDYENVLTGSENGTISLDSPVPLLAPFALIEILEDSSFIIYHDTLRAHVSDVDTPLDDITFSLEANYLTLTPQGDNYLVAPPLDWDGRDTVWITSSDGYYYDEEPWPVYVVNVNDAPVLSDIPDIEFPEDSVYTLELDNLVSDVDDELSDLVWGVESGSSDLDVSISTESHVATFTPAQDFYNTGISVSFMVQDTSGATDTTTAIVNITAVNDPPVFSGTLPDISFLEDSSYSVPVSDWYGLVGDVDDADNTLDWVFDEDINISVSQDNGAVTFTPDPDWYGDETLTVIVSDGFLSDSTDLLISVASVNDAPASFDLLSPDDEYLLSVSDIAFYWNSTTDVDDVQLETFFHLVTGETETIQAVDGENYSLNVFAWELPYGDPIQWWIEVSDGDTSTVSETRIFTVSTDLNHTGPSWFVDVDGSDTNGNGSSTYPFSTIQHAHDVSAQNDTIQIQVGTYYEHITIDHSLTIMGVTVFAEKPVLDGSGSGRIITIGDNATLNVIDLTFSNGYTNDQGGGAIYAFYEPLHVINCEFIGNTVDGGGRGGAIKTHSENSIIKNCYFEGNQSLSSNGGALELHGGLVDSCTFAANTAYQSGGAINIEDNATVRRSLFTDNTAGSNGGAIYIALAAADVINNTVYSNQANYGGGISTYNSASSIVNTILWQNSAYSSGSQYYHSGSPSPAFDYCDVQGGVSGTGNINEDPVFLDPDLMLFDLIEGSPCIDAAHPDLDGDDTQWMDDPDDQDLDGTRMDIGAFTYLGPDTIPPTVNVVSPAGGENYGTGETVSLQWDADDDRIINWTKVYLSYDGGATYEQLDSLPGNPGGVNWGVFDSTLTEQGQIKVEVADWGDNIVEDISNGLFSVVDIIDPEITLLVPGSNFSVLEYEPLMVVWESSDNIAVDSVTIMYTNGESPFASVGTVPASQLQYEFYIPAGVTDNAQIKIVVMDEAGNTDEDLSEYFSVTDNTPPTVTITTPDGAAIGETINLEWSASDNTTLRSHHLYYSQELGFEFVFIDSVDGTESTLSWVAPNFVSDQVRVRVATYDVVNLSSSDTSAFFPISDGTPPTITVSAPTAGSSIAEYEDLTVSWSASDNIEMDSVQIYFSNDGGSEFTLMGQVPDPNTEYVFSVPSGVTNSAQVRLVAVDIYGNEGEDLSDFFSVTDNTPPQVTVNEVSDAGTQDSLYITWDASDNTGIASNVLYFSSNNGDTYILIDSVDVEMNAAQTRAATFPINSANTRNHRNISAPVLSRSTSTGQSMTESRTIYNYTWVAPDLVSDQCKIKVVSYDLVSLSTENESEVFSIFDGVDPVVEVTSPLSGYSILEYEDATVSWNATDNIEMDSIRIFFSNDGGNEFTLVGQVSAPINEYVFSIPLGVTDNSQIRLVAVDIYGNEGEAFSDYFSVTDNTHPEVMVEDLDDVHIADEISIQWSASDNTGLGYHKIYFSPELNQNFALIDSVGGSDQSTSWTVPNIDTDEARLLIETTDIVGLTDLDTTNTFTILDGIPPVLTVTGPSDGYTIAEYHTLTVSWNASDNIALDSAFIEYTSLGENDYTVMGSTLAITGNFDFMIPQGMTNEARIRVTIFDIAGNMALDSSSIFTVTDFTPPSIQIESPVIGERFDIDGTMDIVWLADDNVNVENVDITYSVNNGTSWQEIQLNNENNGNYSWMVINDPSDSVQVRTIAFDAIGLSDTSIVGGLSIDIVYPIVSLISPVPGTLDWQNKQIEIQFSQQMMPEGFSSDFINFTSDHSDTVNSIFTYIDSTQSVVMDLSTGFASRDSITITLNAAGVANYYGYALDGNADGEGGDSYSFGYKIGMAGDYNLDNALNGSDLAIFVSSWENDSYVNELGPYSGDVPNIVIHPDQAFNIEDVMSFVVMGNWYLDNGGLLVSNSSVVGSTLSYDIENDSILIDLPLGIVAFDFELNYDLNQVSPVYEKTPEQLTLIHFDKTGGKMNVISEVKLDNRITIPFTLEEKESQIQLFINGYDSKGILIAQLMETITLNAVPEEFVLSQNYPNPFNPVTQINYGLPKASRVHLAIYDILGREVTTLVNWEQDAGYKSITWNGTDAFGKPVGAGMYFYMVKAKGFRQVRKMVLLK